jgi:hypothetical protein
MEGEMEEWRPVTEPDFEDSYLVSSMGRVARIMRGGRSKSTGYISIILARKGVAYRAYRVHQLVARAFNGPQPEGTIVNHKDADKGNNQPANLEYVTQGDNVRHGIRMGCRLVKKNPSNGQFAPVLTVDQVGEIKAMLPCGVPLHVLAEEYGVSTMAIKYIKIGRNWNRVPAKA